jgi:hypothetical protein
MNAHRRTGHTRAEAEFFGGLRHCPDDAPDESTLALTIRPRMVMVRYHREADNMIQAAGSEPEVAVGIKAHPVAAFVICCALRFILQADQPLSALTRGINQNVAWLAIEQFTGGILRTVRRPYHLLGRSSLLRLMVMLERCNEAGYLGLSLCRQRVKVDREELRF